jgi:outer membrane receptor for monomeric catechols
LFGKTGSCYLTGKPTLLTHLGQTKCGARLIQSDTAANSANGARGFVKLQPNWLALRFSLRFCAIQTSHAKERKSNVLVTCQTGTIFQTVPNKSIFLEAALSGEPPIQGASNV